MSDIISKINSSADVKKLNKSELVPLCSELRSFIVSRVADNGGHLASNLGIVELTVALHRVYDSEKDRIIFDVGHQSYVHKILSGRRDRMDTLRQFGGLSGFPRPYESNSDAFVGGHASNSVSAALGIARARTLMHGNYSVCAVIGDGALTGGLSYEGLADAAQSGEPLVIVINDNKMSIDKNVGGTSTALQKMRTARAYIDFKNRYRNIVSNFPRLYKISHSIKEKIKDDVLPENIYTALGYNYLGPVDGHNVFALEQALRLAKGFRGPVVLHVVTSKGKGYLFSEKTPEIYHGVGKFDPEKGIDVSLKHDFSAEFGSILCELAEKDKRIAAVTAAMKDGTGLAEFSSRFPERFFDVGIAEGHAVTMCAGMAKQGMIPVFAVYSSFLQRAYDMLIHDVSLMNLHVVLCVDRAGLVGSDGESHQGCFDIAFLRSIPGMKIYCPASFDELRVMLDKAINEDTSPVAVRYPRGGEENYSGCLCDREAVIRQGSDITLISSGVLIGEALLAAEALEKKGISAEIVKLGIIDNGPLELCAASAAKTGRFIVIEDVCGFGGIGSDVLQSCAEKGSAPVHALLNAGSGIVTQGTVGELRKLLGIDAEGIVKKALELTGNK